MKSVEGGCVKTAGRKEGRDASRGQSKERRARAKRKKKRGENKPHRPDQVPHARVGVQRVHLRLRLRVHRPEIFRRHLAIGESSVILLTLPLPLVGVSIDMAMECQQNDSLANGYRHHSPAAAAAAACKDA